MPNVNEVEQAMLDLLPPKGQAVPYAEFVSQLSEAGFGGQVARLRQMRRRGLVKMNVSFGDDGMLHTVERGEAG